MPRIPLIAMLVLFTAFPSAVSAGNWFVGAGLGFGNISSDEPTLVDGVQGAGFSLEGGYRFTPHVSTHATLAGFSTSDVDCEVDSIGWRFDLLDVFSRGYSPWAGVYLSALSAEWDRGETLDTMGASVGGGLDLRIGPRSLLSWSIRVFPVRGELRNGILGGSGDFDSSITQFDLSWRFHWIK